MQKIIQFKSKTRKLAVLASIREKQLVQGFVEERADEVEAHSEINENDVTRKYTRRSELVKEERMEEARQVLFLRGAAESVLQSCARESYPEDSLEYIVDMA